MRTRTLKGAVAAMLVGTAIALFQAAAVARPTSTGTAFTYQGQLKQGGDLVNNTADMQFSLWDGTDGSATQFGTTLQIDALDIVEGIFTVDLDFGAGVFGAEARWLQIAVRSPAGAGAFTVLTPRQRIHPTPVAGYALTSGGIGDGGLPPTYSNPVALTNPANSFSGGGAGLTNLNASNIASGVLPSSVLFGTYSSALTLSNAANAFTGSGSGLTGLNASNINTGTIDNARTTGTATNTPNTLVLRDGSGNFSAGAITANGSGLTDLNASNIATGTLNESRLPGSLLDRVPDISPALAGSAATATQVQSVVVSGSFAYLPSRNTNTLQMFNVSNPNNPVFAFGILTASDPRHVAVSAGHAFVVNAVSNSLQAFNVSGPIPTLAGSVATDTNPWAVAVSGNHAYVLTSASQKLQVFNVTNPNFPALAGSVATGFNGTSVAVSGGFAYTVGTQAGVSSLRIFDISNPSSPALIGTVGTALVPTNVVVAGNHAFVTNFFSNNLQVFDVTNPAAPSLAATVPTGNQPTSVAVSGNYAYVVSQSVPMMQVFDVSSIDNIAIVTDIPTQSGPSAVAISGGFAYVTGGANQLQAFRINRLQFDAQVYSSDGFNGSGSGLTNLNASNIATGTIGSSLLSGSYTSALTFNNAANSFAGNFVGNGAGLTSLTAANLTGTVGTSALSGIYSNALTLSNAGNSFTGNGAGLSALNAANITSGTISNLRTTGTSQNTGNTLVLRDASGNFSGNIILGLQLNGAHGGDGQNLVNLNAGSLGTGTVPSPRLSGTYSNPLTLNHGGNSFTGNGAGLNNLNANNLSSGIVQSPRVSGTYSNALTFNNASNAFTGDGAGLSALNASNIASGNLNSTHMPTGGTWALSSTQIVTGPAGFVTALRSTSADYNAIEGFTNENIGIAVYGNNADPNGRAVVGAATGAGSFAVYAEGNSGASGTKSFQIDHPRDPENQYLLHYSAEGPEPYNLYRGNVILDNMGEAWVDLPEYFEDINRDFHYQLTSVGAPAPNLHVGQKIESNTFKIAGGPPLGEVSWTVTATRNDEYVRHYPTADVREKPAALRGTYQHPEIFGQPLEKGEAYRREHLAQPEN